MIGIIHCFDGQVMKFGGDAILCFFPGNDTLHSTIYAAKLMQQEMSGFLKIPTLVKVFSLTMKIGIASGKNLIAGVGDSKVRCEYVFAGTPVDSTSDAEHLSTSGEIVAKIESGKENKLPKLEAKKIEVDFYLIKSIAPLKIDNTVKSIEDDTIASQYIVKEIFSTVKKGFKHYVEPVTKKENLGSSVFYYQRFFEFLRNIYVNLLFFLFRLPQ